MKFRTLIVACVGIVAIVVLNLWGGAKGLDARQIAQASDAIMWCVGFVGLRSTVQAGATGIASAAGELGRGLGGRRRAAPAEDLDTEEEPLPLPDRATQVHR
jgi:hypothetical protein